MAHGDDGVEELASPAYLKYQVVVQFVFVGRVELDDVGVVQGFENIDFVKKIFFFFDGLLGNDLQRSFNIAVFFFGHYHSAEGSETQDVVGVEIVSFFDFCSVLNKKVLLKDELLLFNHY